MFRKLVCAAVVMVVAVAFVAADDFSGVIKKVDGDKITFQEMTKAKKGAKAEPVGDAKTFTVTKDTKYSKKSFDKAEKKVVEADLPDGIKSEVFTKLDAEMGVGATVSVTDGKVTKIVVGGGKGGKGKGTE